jgi:hypothetical protein
MYDVSSFYIFGTYIINITFDLIVPGVKESMSDNNTMFPIFFIMNIIHLTY